MEAWNVKTEEWDLNLQHSLRSRVLWIPSASDIIVRFWAFFMILESIFTTRAEVARAKPKNSLLQTLVVERTVGIRTRTISSTSCMLAEELRNFSSATFMIKHHRLPRKKRNVLWVENLWISAYLQRGSPHLPTPQRMHAKMNWGERNINKHDLRWVVLWYLEVALAIFSTPLHVPAPKFM